MVNDAKASHSVTIACLVLVAALSIPSVVQCYLRATRRKPQTEYANGVYEDKDGAATEESQKAYRDLLPRVVTLLATIVGLLDALASAIILSSVGDNQRQHELLIQEQWMQCAIWLLVLIQSMTLFVTPSSTKRYVLGIYGAFSSLLIAFSLGFENVSLWLAKIHPQPQKVHLTLSIVEFLLALILTCTNALIPRRPDVFYDGTVVDRQNTVSLLAKLTFSWPTSVLEFATKNRGLNISDLPHIDHDTRSKKLREQFEQVGKVGKLWKAIFWAHRDSFLQQWLLQALTSVFNFLPQLALFSILRFLERRDKGDNVQLESWLLVLGLGAAITIDAWIEAWMFFTTYMKIGIPVFEQLSAVIFGKAIRRKDVKGVAKARKEDDAGESNGIAVSKTTGIKGEDTAMDEADEEEDENEGDGQKTRQSTINLIGVDGKRIADFATYNYIILGACIKLVVAFVFLAQLVGWIPLLAGLAVPVAITPFNVIAAKHYGTAQDDLMKYRDQKMAVVTEALQGIRQIKFSALEKNWYEKILQSRRRELNAQWSAYVWDTILISIWIFGPTALSAFTLATYVLVNKELTASVAFTTISVFEAIEMTLAIIPEMITDLLDAIVSSARVQEYLDAPDRGENSKAGQTITFTDATIAWPSDNHDGEDERFRLRNLNLQFPRNELSVISGKTGSGKSLLLASLVGEADILNGRLTIPRAPPSAERFDAKASAGTWILPSAIGFVAQICWIENATIKENILFGLPMDQTRYKKVLEVCALEKDLEMLEDGDMTEIGASGVNMSGGQKWRVSFARALYSRAGVLVLDDIFSAVDANVGRHLFEKALTGELGRGRTRILVTHHVALCLPKTTYSVLLGDGVVEHAGRTEDLRRDGHLTHILEHDVKEQRKEEEDTDKSNALTVDDGGGLQKMLSNTTTKPRRRSALSDAGMDLTRRRSHANMDDTKASAPKKFTEEESRETGAIKYKIYLHYFRASRGFSYWSFILIMFAAAIAAYLGRSFWLSKWTRSYQTESAMLLEAQLLPQRGRLFVQSMRADLRTAQIDPQLKYYLGVYLAISLVAWAVATSRYFLVYVASIHGSRVLFEELTARVLRAPLRWLDTVPLGRILNRFTSDFNLVDSRISNDLSFMLHNSMQVLEVFIAGVFVTPFMLIFAVLLLAVSAYIARKYLAGAREAKRLESVAKSPIFEQFGSVLAGIATIRAFDKADAYIDRMFTLIDTHATALWHQWLFNRWMSWRLNVGGAVFATITAASIVSITSIDAPLAGFALSFALGLSEGIQWTLRQYANLELDMNATERIVEYTNIKIESTEGKDAPAAWPTQGELEVEDLVVGYASDLPPVLKGLSFKVRRSQRVGVVGRTGAGKSSLTLALFRFLEARSGSILIDGIDISTITLDHLRSRLAIIPQDPVLFSGSVRSNLDPFDQHEDAELRDALARVHLISSSASGSATPVLPHHPTLNVNIFKSLGSKISEGGLNLSQGQRQLLCLARSIVSRPKIMVLDEATSAVDMETDALIQRSIREEFQNSTLLVIAHRLSTIADFDRILVMGDGKVLEYDEPRKLMEKENGEFRKMVEESGERTELERVIYGADVAESSS